MKIYISLFEFIMTPGAFYVQVLGFGFMRMPRSLFEIDYLVGNLDIELFFLPVYSGRIHE